MKRSGDFDDRPVFDPDRNYNGNPAFDDSCYWSSGGGRDFEPDVAEI